MSSITAERRGTVKHARLQAGLSQGELARRAGISRQALGAIESGAYQPGVAVAIRLAHELGQSVESLFGEGAPQQISAAWAGGRGHPVAPPGARVALARVGGRVIAAPLSASTLSLAPAAGMVEHGAGSRVSVEAFRSREEIDSTLLIAGCDPAVTLLADWLARHRAPVEIAAFRCASGAALEALLEGRAHVAGIHLRDPASGDYNLLPVRRELRARRVALVNFASWELGLGVHPQSAGKLRAIEDLVQPGVRIVNREAGAGARLALDELLNRLGIDRVQVSGYEHEVGGHLEVAAAVSAGAADTGITIRVAAEAYGLGFIPLRQERYDFVIPQRELEAAPVRAMLEALNSSNFARELSSLCAYDTSRTGTMVGARSAESGSGASVVRKQ